MDTSISIEGESNKIEKIKTKTNGKKIVCEYYNFCYKSNNIITKFNFKNASKNNKFYYCYKRGKGCGGLAVYDIIREEFRVYKECNFEIDHENINYEAFERMYNNNKLDKIDLNLKKYQRYFFRAEFKNNEAIDKIVALDKFKKKFGTDIKIKLNDNEINSEKSKMYPFYFF